MQKITLLQSSLKKCQDNQKASLSYYLSNFKQVSEQRTNISCKNDDLTVENQTLKQENAQYKEIVEKEVSKIKKTKAQIGKIGKIGTKTEDEAV